MYCPICRRWGCRDRSHWARCEGFCRKRYPALLLSRTGVSPLEPSGRWYCAKCVKVVRGY